MNMFPLLRKSVAVILCVLALYGPVSLAGAATVTKLQCGAENTWFTGAATLPSNTQVVTAAAVNQSTCAGYRHADCTFSMPAPASAISAGGTIVVWARIATDLAGTVFPDGSTSITPQDLPLMTFALSAGSNPQIVYAHISNLPTGSFKAVLRADNTGGTINNSPAWTLKCRPYTEQVN